MKASIISIGNELLDGKISNKNAEFIMSELGMVGIPVDRQMTVQDDELEIINALKINSDKDLILTTGGLGTTDDDKSKATVEKYLKDSNIDYESISMENKNGYFNGVFYKFGNGGIMIFPGPPREMNAMLRNNLNLLIDENLHVVRNTYKLGFLNEWTTHDMLREAGVPTEFVNTFVDSDGSVYMKLYMEDKDKSLLESKYKDVDNKINDTFYPLIYTNEDISREASLIKELIDNKYTISCAESYTGGKIISSLIEVKDASKVIEDSYITYSDESKCEILGLDQTTIDEYGVVSEEVCSAMLDGLYNRTKSDICIATTGYAGPTGDVGNVFIGIRFKDKNYIFKEYMKYSRRWIMNRSKNLAIDYTHLIIKELLEQGSKLIDKNMV